MNEFDRVIEGAVSRNDLPFAVAMVAGREGIRWSGAAGEANPGQPAGPDTVFKIFSMTKAVGSTAAMILMDRGLLSPDATVESILPEFADIRLLEAIGPEGAVLREPRVKATVRHLATHTSGLAYEVWNDKVGQYQEKTQSPSILSGLKSALYYPLQSEPGTQWHYGIGIDWLGQIVEKVDGRSIDKFCREEILEPLAMHDTHFEIDPSWAHRVAGLKIRGEDGQFTDLDFGPPRQPEFYGMGHALYATAPDYMRFLRMYLNGGELDGQRILGRATVEALLKSQTGSMHIPGLTTAAPAFSASVDFFPAQRKSHSMAFLRVDEDVPGMRSAGSQTWAGLLNTHYWFDPRSNVAGVLMTQSLPFAEPRFMKTYQDFEQAVYRQAHG
jgi:methyl acetate hydrolase